MPTMSYLSVRETREAAYTRAKAAGDKPAARALLIALRKEREQREASEGRLKPWPTPSHSR